MKKYITILGIMCAVCATGNLYAVDKYKFNPFSGKLDIVGNTSYDYITYSTSNYRLEVSTYTVFQGSITVNERLYVLKNARFYAQVDGTVFNTGDNGLNEECLTLGDSKELRFGLDNDYSAGYDGSADDEFRIVRGANVGTDANVAFRVPISTYVAIGYGGTVNYADGQGDLYVPYDLEVDSNIYCPIIANVAQLRFADGTTQVTSAPAASNGGSIPVSSDTTKIVFGSDGGGSAVTTGFKWYQTMSTFTILNSWQITMSSQTSATVYIQTTTFANFQLLGEAAFGTVATLTASSQYISSGTLTTILPRGALVGMNINAIADTTKISVELFGLKDD